MSRDGDVGEGTLGKSRKKSDNPKAPGYNGSLTITKAIPAGTKLWLSAWRREGQSGPFFSIVAQLPQEPTRTAPKPQEQDGFDDEIPF